MEILFIWLEKYRNFTEQGFNFSTEYIFNFEKDQLSGIYNLSIRRNPRFIPNFFNNPNIKNVTAIIGQNGSGKTSVLDFIKTQLPSFNQEWDTAGVIAFRDHDVQTILVPDSIKLNHSEEMEGFHLHRYPFRFPKEGDYIEERYYDDADYIYYSNIVDLKNEDVFQSGIYNISTLALIKSDNFHSDEDAKYTTQPQTDNFSRFKANEIRRNVQFIIYEDRSLLPFELPEYLFISVLNSDQKILMSSDSDIGVLIKEIESLPMRPNQSA
jgi:hypothetical protein